MPDAETSISEEPGARKGHAGICAGAARATGRPTAMPDCRTVSHMTMHIALLGDSILDNRAYTKGEADRDVVAAVEAQSEFSFMCSLPQWTELNPDLGLAFPDEESPIPHRGLASPNQE